MFIIIMNSLTELNDIYKIVSNECEIITTPTYTSHSISTHCCTTSTYVQHFSYSYILHIRPITSLAKQVMSLAVLICLFVCL